MQFSISVDTAQPDDGRGPVTIGWFFHRTESSVVFGAPQRVRARDQKPRHPKSASSCPAVIGLENRLFEIPCPIDLSLSFERSPEGKAGIRASGGPRTAVRATKLQDLVSLTREEEWRDPDRPIVQLVLPYVFVSDDAAHLNQLAPFLHYRPDPMPGTIIAGRFPVHVWPRPLMWAFEWHDTSKPLRLERGEPLFYVQFETSPPDRAIQLVEAERTPELLDYFDAISGAVNYVNQTFSLFQEALDRRPARLLVPKKR